MGKSRNELKKSLLLFNSRASTTWSKDDSKFGQRMLEKMGWKKGEGLGAQHQGITDNIKLRLKLDAKGLGFKENDDQWLKVEHGFSSVLSKLKEQADVKLENVNSNETKSLESKSSLSKSRVHYSKYTRGKDVSRYNEEDLIGILGRSRKRRSEDDTETDELDIIDGVAKKKGIESSRQKPNFSATEDNDHEEANTEETGGSRLANSPSAVSSTNTGDECQIKSARRKSEDRKKKRKKTCSSLENGSAVGQSDDKLADDELLKRELSSSSSEFVSTKKNIIKEFPHDEPPDTSSNVSLNDAANDTISGEYETRRARKKSKKNRKDAELVISPKENDCNEIDDNELPDFPSTVSLENEINNASSNECEKRSRKKREDGTKKRKKKSRQEANFNTTEFVPMEDNITEEMNYEENKCDKLMNSSLAASCHDSFLGESKKSEDERKNETETDFGISSSFVPRKSTRAERIVEKSRLLRKIQNGETYHEFIGSNITKISGYGTKTYPVK